MAAGDQLHLPVYTSGTQGLGFIACADLPAQTAYTPEHGDFYPCVLTLLRHPIDQTPTPWYGILTCFPSPTAFALDLGPTDPGRINLPQETLGLRRTSFSLVLSLLVPTFSFVPRPALLTVRLRPTAQRSPTPATRRTGSQAVVSVACLSPVTFSAQEPSTSELLRTL